MSETKRPWLVIVGGFLGAGKTSLILAAARLLEARGMRCAAILNDQGVELVDTKHAQAETLLAREVTGGCFCCKLSGLMDALEELSARSPEVIFAEPVGSCTDISATVLGPLREEFDRYRLAPFTVLADPARVRELLGDDADADMGFLFRKQLQEADLVCLSKSDLYPDAERIAGIESRAVSAQSGQGVSEWLDEILNGRLEAGMRTLDIDYGRYAQAEAALAWLNLSFTFEPVERLSPALAVGPFLEWVDEGLTASAIGIAHLKIFDSSTAGWLKAALCANGTEPRVEGNLDAPAARRHEMLVNLRAKGDPAVVRRIVEEQLGRLDGTLTEVRLDCFSPAAPKPEMRVARARV